MFGKILSLAYFFMAAMPIAAAQQTEDCPSRSASKEATKSPGGLFKLQAKYDALPSANKPILSQYAERSQLDSNAGRDLLHGGLIQNAGPMSTVQKRLGLFTIDSMISRTQISPGLVREFNAQIARSQLQPEAKEDSADMQAELARPKPRFQGDIFQAVPQSQNYQRRAIELPAIPRTPQIDPAAVQEMQEASTRPRSNSQGGASPSKVKIVEDLAWQMNSKLKQAKQQEQKQSPSRSSQINGELLHVTPQTVPGLDIDKEIKEQQARSKPQTDAELSRAKSAMEAVFRRPLQAPKLNTDAQITGRGGHGENTISWDKWYARIAKSCEPRLLKAMERHGNPSGSNTISMTVLRNHRLSVILIRGKNSNFDAATLEAYKSLDGNGNLEFPDGSCRREVTFFIDNKHNIPGGVSGINSQTCLGDKEIRSNEW